jgi:hypothetical protein
MRQTLLTDEDHERGAGEDEDSEGAVADCEPRWRGPPRGREAHVHGGEAEEQQSECADVDGTMADEYHACGDALGERVQNISLNKSGHEQCHIREDATEILSQHLIRWDNRSLLKP